MRGVKIKRQERLGFAINAWLCNLLHLNPAANKAILAA